jgi:RES domain-containing protein
MPIIPGLTTNVGAGRTYYRITPRAFWTGRLSDHKKVVNGAGAVRDPSGGRYHYPGVQTVYLAEDPATCFAERMFYFHRNVLLGLDTYHRTRALPTFQKTFVLWEIHFKNDIPDVFELSVANASAMNIFPTLMLNPSQDYEHLKDRRAAIQSNGYQGLRAPSSRVRGTGQIVVLFQDQSKNVQGISPHEVAFRMITSSDPPAPFTNHAADLLDFTAGEVRVRVSPGSQGPNPTLAAHQDWTRIEFNH